MSFADITEKGPARASKPGRGAIFSSTRFTGVPHEDEYDDVVPTETANPLPLTEENEILKAQVKSLQCQVDRLTTKATASFSSPSSTDGLRHTGSVHKYTLQFNALSSLITACPPDALILQYLENLKDIEQSRLFRATPPLSACQAAALQYDALTRAVTGQATAALVTGPATRPAPSSITTSRNRQRPKLTTSNNSQKRSKNQQNPPDCPRIPQELHDVTRHNLAARHQHHPPAVDVARNNRTPLPDSLGKSFPGADTDRRRHTNHRCHIDIIIDSGATEHMFVDGKIFNTKLTAATDIEVANGSLLPSAGTRTVLLHQASSQPLLNVLHVPIFHSSLFSVARACDHDAIVIFDARTVQFAIQPHQSFSPPDLVTEICTTSTLVRACILFLQHALATTVDWHRRMTHLGKDNLLHLSKIDTAVTVPPDIKCEPCQLAKATHLLHPPSLMQIDELLALIHTDMVRPLLLSLTGEKYVISWINHASRYAVSHAIPNKEFATVQACLEAMRTTAECQTSKLIKCLRSNPGGKYLSDIFCQSLMAQGIQMQSTIRDTPAQNGLYAHVLKSERRDKFAEAAQIMYLVGYAATSKGYRLWDPIMNVVCNRYDVHFDETKTYRDNPLFTSSDQCLSIDSTNEEHVIERVLDHQATINGIFKFLLIWRGFPSSSMRCVGAAPPAPAARSRTSPSGPRAPQPHRPRSPNQQRSGSAGEDKRGRRTMEGKSAGASPAHAGQDPQPRGKTRHRGASPATAGQDPPTRGRSRHRGARTAHAGQVPPPRGKTRPRGAGPAPAGQRSAHAGQVPPPRGKNRPRGAGPAPAGQRTAHAGQVPPPRGKNRPRGASPALAGQKTRPC
ncbi:MAG: hypothetical protein BJ554DRAFT_6425, partial [Olpidium bornovanus]